MLYYKLSNCCSLPGGVVAEYEVVTGLTRPVNDAGVIRGDDIDTTQLSDEGKTLIH